MQKSALRPARTVCLLLILTASVSLALTGCGGGGAGVSASGGGDTFPANLPNYHTPEQWIALIETAGFQDYADLGRQLVREGKVTVVTPPTLDAQFNAYSWISDKEIWINAPMFTRYPDITQQATIFLHELIHIRSAESTHTGPWWSVQDQFAVYWQTHSLSPQQIAEQ